MYQSCCGKTICLGCIYAVKEITKPGKLPLCPFCRTPNPRTSREAMESLMKRVKMKIRMQCVRLGLITSMVLMSHEM